MKIRADGEISVGSSGLAYLPENVRRELGVEGGGKVPFFTDGKIVLLVRDKTELEDIFFSFQTLLASILSKADLTPKEKEKLKEKYGGM